MSSAESSNPDSLAKTRFAPLHQKSRWEFLWSPNAPLIGPWATINLVHTAVNELANACSELKLRYKPRAAITCRPTPNGDGRARSLVLQIGKRIKKVPIYIGPGLVMIGDAHIPVFRATDIPAIIDALIREVENFVDEKSDQAD